MALRPLPKLIGVIHLPSLAGTPEGEGQSLSASAQLERAGWVAIREAKLLAQAGFEGIILENFGDTPFYKTSVPPETIASMAIIAAAVREVVRVPIGINILRNDARSALGVAAVTGCSFIRVNVLTGVVATDQGLIEGDAASLLREKARLAPGISILADVHVKHARTLSSDDIAIAIEDTTLRARADGVILTGSTTGRAVDLAILDRAWEAAKFCKKPLYIGSGANLENLSELKKRSSGIIVGSFLRQGGKAGAPLDPKRIKAFVKAYRLRNAKKKKK